jgi:hypothetical protein
MVFTVYTPETPQASIVNQVKELLLDLQPDAKKRKKEKGIIDMSSNKKDQPKITSCARGSST